MKRSDRIEPGMVFNRLTVLSKAYVKKYPYGGVPDRMHIVYWYCKCVCGNERAISGSALRNGHTKSCGCIRKGRASPARKASGVAAMNYLYSRYKASAKTRGLLFDIPFSVFKILVTQPCFYCQAAPKYFDNAGKNHGGVYVNGIDRDRSTGDYIIENAVPCCSNCNYAKGSMTRTEFLAWVTSVYRHSCATLTEIPPRLSI